MKPACLLLAAAAVALMNAAPARAAESYDNCTGFVDSVPATIATQGTWCLRKDLSAAMSSGAAITIAANNTTLDCNDFKLGGLAGGEATTATGIYANERVNLTVRHCNVRGFAIGIRLYDQLISYGGHVVEDNRLEGNTERGIYVGGDASVVRRNLVRDTGGSPNNPFYVAGIYLAGDIDAIDNAVDGVFRATGDDGVVDGIRTFSDDGGRIVGNGIRGLLAGAGHEVSGIYIDGAHARLRDNDVLGPAGHSPDAPLRVPTFLFFASR